MKTKKIKSFSDFSQASTRDRKKVIKSALHAANDMQKKLVGRMGYSVNQYATS